MKIKVVYMGGSRGQSGCVEEFIELPEGATVGDAQAAVTKMHPALAPLMASVRWACNYEFSDNATALNDGDELALLPPVAGGAPRGVLTKEPLDADSVVKQVQSATMGATVVFIGTVRDHSRGKTVTHLFYEAYETMAQKQLDKIAADCSALRPGTEVAIAHRHGELRIGDTSIVIAAASAHRDDAFACCREAIERIKVDVPIWKQEFTDDGETWVGWGGG